MHCKVRKLFQDKVDTLQSDIDPPSASQYCFSELKLKVGISLSSVASVTHFPVWLFTWSGVRMLPERHDIHCNIVRKMKLKRIRSRHRIVPAQPSVLWEPANLMVPRSETAAFYSCHKDNLAVWEFMVSNKRAQNLDTTL